MPLNIPKGSLMFGVWVVAFFAMNNQLIVLAFKDFFVHFEKQDGCHNQLSYNHFFKPFQEKLTIKRGCFTNCICSICACVSAITTVSLFHSLNNPLSVDTLMHLVTNASEF